MILVTGATGKTGSVVASKLLDEGESVRVLVRTAEKGAPLANRGAEVVVGDVGEVKTLTAAMQGTRGAYLLIPPDPTSQDQLARGRRLADTQAEAVQRSGVGNVVFLSSIGAHREEGVGPVRMLSYGEKALRRVARTLTILRPGYFVENWLSVLPSVKGDGVLPSFLPEGEPSIMVATADIGRVAADALRTPPAPGAHVVEMAGPREYLPREVAEELGARMGREVRLQSVPLEAVVPTFTSFGLSLDLARLYHEMFAGMAEGYFVPEGSPAAELVRGTLTPGEVLGPHLA